METESFHNFFFLYIYINILVRNSFLTIKRTAINFSSEDIFFSRHATSHWPIDSAIELLN